MASIREDFYKLSSHSFIFIFSLFSFIFRFNIYFSIQFTNFFFFFLVYFLQLEVFIRISNM